MKRCPYCAEEIQDDAIKCKHCGEWLKTEKNTVIQTHTDIKNNAPQERSFSEKSNITKTTITGTTVKSEVTEKQFNRFKIFTILFYIIFFASCLLILSEGTKYQAPLIMIYAVCFLMVTITFLIYLWKCAKIVQKRPLYYTLCIFVPLVGVAWAYIALKSHYDHPSTLEDGKATQKGFTFGILWVILCLIQGISALLCSIIGITTDIIPDRLTGLIVGILGISSAFFVMKRKRLGLYLAYLICFLGFIAGLIAIFTSDSVTQNQDLIIGFVGCLFSGLWFVYFWRRRQLFT